jgi:hypothetical protein
MMPAELQGDPTISAHEFWMVLSSDPTAHMAYHWTFVVGGFAGLALVPSAFLLTKSANLGWAIFGGAIGALGFTVNIRSHLMEIAFDQKIIPIYQTADAATQKAVHVAAGLALDVPDGFLTFGGIGFWILVVSVLAFRVPTIPRWFSVFGVLVALSYWAGTLGYVLLNQQFLIFSLGVGGLVLAPAWYLAVGRQIRRAANAEQGG